jgi:hypothetical protein
MAPSWPIQTCPKYGGKRKRKDDTARKAEQLLALQTQVVKTHSDMGPERGRLLDNSSVYEYLGVKINF